MSYFSDAICSEITAQRVRQAGGKAVIFRADVSKEDEVLSMLTRMIVELGRIDILINNSGIHLNALFDEMTCISGSG